MKAHLRHIPRFINSCTHIDPTTQLIIAVVYDHYPRNSRQYSRSSSVRKSALETILKNLTVKAKRSFVFFNFNIPVSQSFFISFSFFFCFLYNVAVDRKSSNTPNSTQFFSQKEIFVFKNKPISSRGQKKILVFGTTIFIYRFDDAMGNSIFLLVRCVTRENLIFISDTKFSFFAGKKHHSLFSNIINFHRTNCSFFFFFSLTFFLYFTQHKTCTAEIMIKKKKKARYTTFFFFLQFAPWLFFRVM